MLHTSIGIFVELLDDSWTDGRGDASPGGRSGCLNCLPPRGNGSEWRVYEESPSMYRNELASIDHRYVVLTAGATCFGVPQPGGDQRWGGTGIYVYTAPSPLGPWTYYGNINDLTGLSGERCAACMGNTCPSGRCALPVQLNSIVRRHDGSPVALTGQNANTLLQKCTSIFFFSKGWECSSCFLGVEGGLTLNGCSSKSLFRATFGNASQCACLDQYQHFCSI